MIRSLYLFMPVALAVSLLIATGCEKKSGDTTSGSGTRSLVDRGKTVYRTSCIACHNSDPKRAGSLGPEVWGSSKELLVARILNATYPPDYQPKRSTHTMAPIPHLKDDIDAIHAYLNAP